MRYFQIIIGKTGKQCSISRLYSGKSGRFLVTGHDKFNTYLFKFRMLEI